MKKYLVGSFKLLDFALQLCSTQIGHVLPCCRVTWSQLLTFILQILKKSEIWLKSYTGYFYSAVSPHRPCSMGLNMAHCAFLSPKHHAAHVSLHLGGRLAPGRSLPNMPEAPCCPEALVGLPVSPHYGTVNPAACLALTTACRLMMDLIPTPEPHP